MVYLDGDVGTSEIDGKKHIPLKLVSIFKNEWEDWEAIWYHAQ